MLIKHTGEIVREARLEDSLAKTGSGSEPQAWHFKTYNDAANYGIELVWPYEDLTIDPQNGPDFEYYTKLSEHFFGIVFPGYIQVPENHNLFIFQHHTHSVAWNMPRPISQMIEYDWWPLSPQVIFEIPSEPSAFIQNKPFAQAMAIPRRTYTVKEMTKEERKERELAAQYLEQHREEYVTRKMEHEGYAEQDNAYETLMHKQRASELPQAIKDQQHRSYSISKMGLGSGLPSI